MNLDMSKAEMLDTYQSAMNHAMVLTGVNLGEDGKPNRWKIENSWGEKIANKGYFLGSDTWFDKYVYVIAVNKKYLPKKALDALKKKPIELAPWDPFGTLAD
jgi:bleomycin hydrolase